ncbi:MAG: transcription elongation factor GreA [Malacoplasma sp.]
MSTNINLMTKDGIEKLKKELRHLIDVRRPKIIKQIQEAREQGDLSENADYDAAKNSQAIIEGRIKEIEEILNHIEIIDEKSNKTKVVKIGSKVKIKDFQDSKNYIYTIVGSIETDPGENKISNECPLAKSIMGKKEGEESHVRGVDEPYKVKILEIL